MLAEPHLCHAHGHQLSCVRGFDLEKNTNMFCNKNMKRAVALSNCASLQRAAAVDDRYLASCLWHQSKVLRRVSPTSHKSPPQDRSSQVYGQYPCLYVKKRTSSPRHSCKGTGSHPPPIGPDLHLVWCAVRPVASRSPKYTSPTLTRCSRVEACLVRRLLRLSFFQLPPARS